MRLALSIVGMFVASALWADDPKGVEFYERKIRPLFVEHCYKCHSAEAETNKKLKGGLLLDHRDALLKGGDSGPAVVLKKPADSLLMKTLRYDGDVKMPPKGKLPEAAIADVEQWIGMGMPGLATGGAAPKKQIGLSIEEGRKFWAYQNPKEHPLPTVRNAAWAKTDLDRFILAKLEANKLTPAATADKATLVRRLYFDLVGLPPTPDQIEAFLTSQDPQAYEKLVDQLLASPQFGERWGRHWLDIARYAESVTLRGFIYKQAWRYRDYVIDAMNRDMPFDQFIREQIAGDLLPSNDNSDKQRQIIATTFLVLGNTNFEEQDKKQLRMDVVDEQIDVITKGFLGQTVTCARCHDHKFDPIPTKDYYAIAGILRNAKAMEHSNVSNWIEVPLPAAPDMEETYKKHEAAIAAIQAKIAAEKGKAPKKIASGVLAVKDIAGIVVDDVQAKKVGDWMDSVHSGHYIGAGYVHDKNEGKGTKTLTFQPESIPSGKYEVRLAYSEGGTRSDAVPVEVFSADGEKTVMVNMQKTPPIDGRFISLGEFRFEKNGQCHVIISNEGTKGHVTADCLVFINTDKTNEAAKTPKANPKAKDGNDIVKTLEAELKKLQAEGPKRPKAMSVVEEKQIEDAKVHVRGSVHNLGEVAPRGFMQVASRGAVTMPKNQSGRKELAEWIASADNPLTAKVFANRVWHWLMGSGLVRTTDNFGTTGETPSHPELLDHLALSFVNNGWSVKKLVRQVVLSQTYQQSAQAEQATRTADPDNRLFGHANRRRLDAECIRDAMLSISGKLDLTPGGMSYPENLGSDYGYRVESARRSVYLPLFRNSMPEALEIFDAADPSMVTGKRNTSTVAQQALYLLNNPFPLEQAKLTAKRLLTWKDDAARISQAYRLILGREPTAGERQVAEKFLRSRDDQQTAWTMLVHAMFAGPDFRYVD